MVIPGNTEGGFTAIKLIDQLPDDYKIVTKGACLCPIKIRRTKTRRLINGQ